MWAFYLFFLYGLVPLIWPQYTDKILYWSNFLQLIALPALAVGAAVLAERTVQRDQETHDAVMKELEKLSKIETYLQNGEWSHGSTNHGRTNKENVG